MSIFDNNVTPEAPTNKNWNEVGYAMWIDILNKKYRQKWDPDNMWFSSAEDAAYYRNTFKDPWKSKNQIKNLIRRTYRNCKHLREEDSNTLDEIIQNAYKKYGVWLKYRIQYNKTGRIKSIYFVRFC